LVVVILRRAKRSRVGAEEEPGRGRSWRLGRGAATPCQRGRAAGDPTPPPFRSGGGFWGEAAVVLEAAPDLHRRLPQHQLVAHECPSRRPQHRPVGSQPFRRYRHFLANREEGRDVSGVGCDWAGEEEGRRRRR
jgi:hypothetical protein